MILVVAGVILIITGAFMITRKTAETWLERRAGKPRDSGEKGKLSYLPIVLVGLGALLLAIATSGSAP
jgi:putative Mn2+ efflux pump MntP